MGLGDFVALGQEQEGRKSPGVTSSHTFSEICMNKGVSFYLIPLHVIPTLLSPPVRRHNTSPLSSKRCQRGIERTILLTTAAYFHPFEMHITDGLLYPVYYCQFSKLSLQMIPAGPLCE